MYVEHILQQVQYKFYVWFHHMLPLSLACRILVHGSQKLSRIQPGSNATTLFAYVIPWYYVLPLLSVMRVILCICSLILFSNLCFFKWSLHFNRQVMNLVWVTFEMMNKLICNYMVGNQKFSMNDKLSLFDCNTNK